MPPGLFSIVFRRPVTPLSHPATCYALPACSQLARSNRTCWSQSSQSPPIEGSRTAPSQQTSFASAVLAGTKVPPKTRRQPVRPPQNNPASSQIILRNFTLFIRPLQCPKASPAALDITTNAERARHPSTACSYAPLLRHQSNMEGATSRLDVLARQLTLAGAPAAAGAGTAAADLSGICPRALGAYLCHDNPELRAAIFDFLKVGSCGAAGAAGAGAANRKRGFRAQRADVANRDVAPTPTHSPPPPPPSTHPNPAGPPVPPRPLPEPDGVPRAHPAAPQEVSGPALLLHPGVPQQ